MQELKQRLASPPAELTPAERKVVRALLATYACKMPPPVSPS
ncbi:hypothetical protein ACLBUY_06775, partial [Pseudomonas aeruginosa]